MYERTRELIKECLRILRQPPLVSIMEWANQYRVLDTTSAKEVGKFNIERTPYMIEIYEKIANRYSSDEQAIIQQFLETLVGEIGR